MAGEVATMSTGLWTRAEIERLHDMAGNGLSVREAARELGKTYQSTLQKARRERIRFSYKKTIVRGEPGDLRERWLKLLPKMKEALRRDLENNI